MDEDDVGAFTGGKLSIGKGRHTESMVGHYNGKELVATQWRNRRPICPYGCDQEGTLVEIIVDKDTGRATGVYKDSEQLIFTAELQMAPKPSSRKLVLGADGQMHLETGEDPK